MMEDDGFGGRRFIEVLIDKKSYKKDNIIEIVTALSKRFKTPNTLYIDIYTSLDQVLTLEERDLPQTSGQNIPHKYTDDAVFIRNDTESFFHMYFSNGKSMTVKLEQK